MYSNCLFEALKAKIKDPKYVRIIRLPKEVNAGICHIMWIKGDTVFHAYSSGGIKQSLLFQIQAKRSQARNLQTLAAGAACGHEGFFGVCRKIPASAF